MQSPSQDMVVKLETSKATPTIVTPGISQASAGSSGFKKSEKCIKKKKKKKNRKNCEMLCS